MLLLITARKRSLRRLCFYRCLSVRGGMPGCWGGVCGCGGLCVLLGGCAWLPGDVCGCWGACLVARGHAWLLGGVHGCWGVVCMVAGGWCAWLPGACVIARGHAWLLGGICYLFEGIMWLQGEACIGYDEIRSMSGRYGSYWNAFLFEGIIFKFRLNHFPLHSPNARTSTSCTTSE